MRKIYLKVMLIFAVLLFCTACGKSEEERIAEQLELGNRYLEEMDYEQAIVAFNKVIEIDAKNIDAYLGKADAYFKSNESEENLKNALDSYEKVVELDLINTRGYLGMADIYIRMDEYEEAVNILEKGYENTEDTYIRDQLVEICRAEAQYYIDKADYAKAKIFVEEGLSFGEDEKLEFFARELKAKTLLSELESIMSEENYEKAAELAKQSEYVELANSLSENELYYCGEYNNKGEKDGIGLALYPVKTIGEYGDCYIYYYGSWKSDQRSGLGVSVCFRPEYVISPYVWYSGNWENDMPNGEGEERYYVVQEELEVNGGQVVYRKANYVEGLYDGEIYAEYICWDGRITRQRGIAEKGVMKPLRENNSDWLDVWVEENGSYGSIHVSGNHDLGVSWLLEKNL